MLLKVLSPLILGALGVLLASVLTPAAYACSVVVSATFVPPTSAGPRPRNAGALARVIGSTEATFTAMGPGSPQLQLVPLVTTDPDDRTFLLRLSPTPAPGSRYTLQANLVTGQGAPASIVLDFNDQVDTLPPSLPSNPTVWAHRWQSSGRLCPRTPGHVLGFRWPAASEAGFVSVVETTSDGTVMRTLADMVIDTEILPEVRLPIEGDPGRTVCFRYKVTDLAGNESPLSAVCCADEGKVTGPCGRVASPPSPFPEPPPASSGCRLGRGQTGVAPLLLVALAAPLFRRRRRSPWR